MKLAYPPMIQIPKKFKKLLNALHPQMPKGTMSGATSWMKQQRSEAKADTMRGWVKSWVEEIRYEETIIFSSPNILEKSIHPNFIKHYFATTSQSSTGELEAIFTHPLKEHVILIDDARCFTGSGDYLSIDTLKELASHNQYKCFVF